jgi:soluble lytic murein transglycosylase-like protein
MRAEKISAVLIALLALGVCGPALAGRPAAHKPAAHHAVAIAKPPVTAKSPFAREAALSPPQLIDRWKLFIDQASRRVGIPAIWIKAILIEESGGRTMLAENTPITSSAGAMGLMQLMPETWQQMRQIYNLGNDPYDPHDNILAGAAYLRSLYWEYGYPGLFAAYNDGPQMIEAHRKLNQMLPAETSKYIVDIAAILQTGTAHGVQFAPYMSAAPQTDTPPDADDAAIAPYPKDNDDDYDGQ